MTKKNVNIIFPQDAFGGETELGRRTCPMKVQITQIDDISISLAFWGMNGLQGLCLTRAVSHYKW